MAGFRVVVYALRLGKLMSVSVAGIYTWFSLNKEHQIFSHSFRDGWFLYIRLFSFVPAYDTKVRLMYVIGGFLRDSFFSNSTRYCKTRQDVTTTGMCGNKRIASFI